MAVSDMALGVFARSAVILTGGWPPHHSHVSKARHGAPGKGCAEGGLVEVESGEREFDTHEEQREFVVLMLVGVKNVGVVVEQEVGDRGHQTLAVWAGDQQDGGVDMSLGILA
jgi:hypothetical protein